MGVNAGRLTRRTDIQWIDAVDHVWGGVVAWLSVWSEVHTAQLMPLPADATARTVSCFSKIQIGFTFLVPAHPACVCV